MDKIKILVIVMAVTLINAGMSYSIFNYISNDDKGKKISDEELISDTIKLVKNNWDFYKHINLTLDMVDANLLDSVAEQFEDEEDGDFRKNVIAIAVHTINQKPEIKEKIDNIKIAYDNSKSEEAILHKDSLFEKNTACAALIPGISEKIEPGDSVGGKNEFEYIFYSSSHNNCIYSVALVEDGKEGYKHYKALYNASSNSELGKYLINVSYSFEDYLGNKGDSFDEQVSNDKKKYVKFVLENSYFNFDLFKDLSYFYGAF